MGFVVLVMVVIILALLRSRVPPRKSGPLIEWAALKEPAYMLFTLGVFLLYWTLYFAFFYVCCLIICHWVFRRFTKAFRFKFMQLSSYNCPRLAVLI